MDHKARGCVGRYLHRSSSSGTTREELAMHGKKMRPLGVVVIAVSVLAVLGGSAVLAQDAGQAKYGVRVPNGLAFSEFRGYESWQVVSISHSEKLLAATLANPEMIRAFQSGIPGNGKPFPDGAKMAKIHWN